MMWCGMCVVDECWCVRYGGIDVCYDVVGCIVGYCVSDIVIGVVCCK